MAYLIITANGEEIDRREIAGPITIGRSPECDWQVRDILMSRRHCRIEPGEKGWIVVDLGSKNGTYMGSLPVRRHALKEGDELRCGRVRITFHSGPLVAAPESMKKRAVVRPADPSEALAGTMSGFVLAEPGEVEYHPKMPVPKPKPAEPESYQRDVAKMVSELASSSWDSIYAHSSQPINKEKAATKALVGVSPAIRPKPRVSFALQAHEHGTDARTVQAMTAARPEPLLSAAPLLRHRLSRWQRAGIAVLVTLVIAAMLFVVWMLLGTTKWFERAAPAVQASLHANIS